MNEIQIDGSKILSENYAVANLKTYEPPKRGKSLIIIGDQSKDGIDIKIEVSTKFNWLQKKMWKYLLNIKIEDIKEVQDELQTR